MGVKVKQKALTFFHGLEYTHSILCVVFGFYAKVFSVGKALTSPRPPAISIPVNFIILAESIMVVMAKQILPYSGFKIHIILHNIYNIVSRENELY